MRGITIMENITPSDLWTGLLVFLAICAAIITISKTIDVIKSWRKPSVDIMECLAKDKRRLDQHDAQIEDLKTGTENLCLGVKALLNHELHDGNSTEMEQASSDLDTWLIRRH